MHILYMCVGVSLCVYLCTHLHTVPTGLIGTVCHCVSGTLCTFFFFELQGVVPHFLNMLIRFSVAS